MTTVGDDTAAPLGVLRLVAIGCVLAAIALVVLDAAIVNVALPAIGSSLHVSVADSVRVVTAYQLALVMALLPFAAIGESFGYRRVYASGVTLFVSASAACAWAPSLAFLEAARFIQGLGGAAIMSLGITLLRSIVDARQLGAAIGWNTLTVGLSSAAGPTLGALVLSVGSWRWLFAINLPLGLLVLLATCALPAVPGSQRKLDGISITLNATAFGLLVIGAELAPYRGVLAMGLLIVAALVLVAVVRRELPKQIPMVPLDLLREASFRVSVIASVCFFVGQSAAMVSMPFHFQHVLGLDNMTTGLTITSWPLSVAVVAPLAGHLVNRFSGAWLCVLGGALLASGLTFVAFCASGGTPLMLAMAACGVGFGLFQVSNNRNMLLSAEPSRSSAAGGMQATARLTGQTVGALVVMLIFNLAPVELAPRLGLAIASGLTMAAGLLSILRSAGL